MSIQCYIEMISLKQIPFLFNCLLILFLFRFLYCLLAKTFNNIHNISGLSSLIILWYEYMKTFIRHSLSSLQFNWRVNNQYDMRKWDGHLLKTILPSLLTLCVSMYHWLFKYIEPLAPKQNSSYIAIYISCCECS